MIEETTIPLANYPDKWLFEIEKLTDSELYNIKEYSINKQNELKDSNSFFHHIIELSRLSALPKVSIQVERRDILGNTCESKVFPASAYQNLDTKKSHELEEVFSYLKNNKVLPNENTVIDFCGGAAYIARTLAYYFKTKSLSVDYNEELQKRASLRNLRFVPKESAELNYLSIDLLSDINIIKNKIPNNSPIIGIHTCGELANSQLTLSSKLKSSWTFNVGCCYFKTKNPELLLSNHARNNPLNLTPNALFLATRGHEFSFKDYLFSKRVKEHRYLLHLFLKSEFDLPFKSVGSVSKKLYEKDFIEYAIDRLKHLYNENLISSIPAESSLKNFIAKQETKNNLNYMISCNFIRSHFSRIIEVAIILDRALYLEENDFEVNLGEIFNPSLSPRNIAIFGRR